MPVTGGGNASSYKMYCCAMGFGLSPFIQNQESAVSILGRWMQITNTAAVWTGYSLKFIPFGDEQITGSCGTYIPPTAATFAFTDDDFYQDGDGDPLEVMKRDWFDAYNAVVIECAVREYDYNSVPIDWIDQSSIEATGRRQAPNIAAHEICETAMATKVVSLIGQRMRYIRDGYTWKGGPEYARIEPMDVGTVFDTALSSAPMPVRIISVDEDDNGILTFFAEEFPGTIGRATIASSTAVTINGQNTQVVPAPVNPPIIFEPNSTTAQFLTGSTAPVVMAAVSGGVAGVVDPNWGGCNVYVSTDNATYQSIGSLAAPSRMGVLTAALPTFAGTNPDTADTLAVSMAESGGAIVSAASGQTAANGTTLCYVGGELIGPQTATLTGANAYGLTNLYRGLFGTTPAAHASGAPFARLDDAIFSYPLPAAYIGVPLWFKFASFNLWGQQTQDLSTCVAYTFTPAGAGFGGGSGGVPTAPTGLAAVATGTTVALSVTPNPATDNVTAYDFYRANGTGAAFGSATKVASAAGGSTTDSSVTAGASYTYFAVARNAVGGSAASAGVNLTVSTTGSGPVLLGFQRSLAAFAASDVAASFEINPAYTLKAGLPGTRLALTGAGATAPTSAVTFALMVAGIAVGSITIGAGSLVATALTLAADQPVASGALVTLQWPSALNGMAGILTGSLAGVR